jgi:hypothetical protein
MNLKSKLENDLEQYYKNIIDELDNNLNTCFVKNKGSLNILNLLPKYNQQIYEIGKIRDDSMIQLNEYFSKSETNNFDLLDQDKENTIKLKCLKKWCVYISNDKLRIDLKNHIGLLIITDRYLNIFQLLSIR